jgi:hypothetical protein
MILKVKEEDMESSLVRHRFHIVEQVIYDSSRDEYFMKLITGIM